MRGSRRCIKSVLPLSYPIMMDCAGTICVILPYLAGGAYIAIMLAVVGVPQLLTHYLENRNRQRDRLEDIAAAEQRRREDRDAAEQRRRDDQATEERRRREDQAAAERRHQETLALLNNTANLMVALLDNRQSAPGPDQAAAIADLQQSVAQLTQMVGDIQHKIQNGNGNAAGNGNTPAQSND